MMFSTTQNSVTLIKTWVTLCLLNLLLTSSASAGEAHYTARLMPIDSSALGDRTPLILIHGIHGTAQADITSPSLDYWLPLLNTLASQGLALSNNYKI